jgi:hypothetical protein
MFAPMALLKSPRSGLCLAPLSQRGAIGGTAALMHRRLLQPADRGWIDAIRAQLRSAPGTPRGNQGKCDARPRVQRWPGMACRYWVL